jgi:hypothetical protein
MPEIDNSLAASVKPLDVGGALAKAAQLREATINADLGQQKLQHNEREYGENAGLTSGERSTMSEDPAGGHGADREHSWRTTRARKQR